MMDRLRSLLFLIVLLAGSVIAIAFSFVASLCGPWVLQRYVTAWMRFHALCARMILGIRTRVEGRLPDGPALVAARHESMYETLELVRILPRPAVVVKRELTDFPLWRWVTRRYGLVPVNREASAAALRDLLKAAQRLRSEQRALVIFPEGTRVAPGDQPPLQSGFAGLYRAMGLPVVPVAIDSGRLWPRKGPKRPGVITFRFGEPIPPGLPRAEIEARVHAAINALNSRE